MSWQVRTDIAEELIDKILNHDMPKYNGGKKPYSIYGKNSMLPLLFCQPKGENCFDWTRKRLNTTLKKIEEPPIPEKPWLELFFAKSTNYFEETKHLEHCCKV
jgi:hypothetical protein